MYRFSSGLWVVGSSSVIDAYIEWQQHSRQIAAKEIQDENYENIRKLTQIIVEMRHDLGYVDDRATANDLLATFITDIKE
jgi:hypothetical protein